MIDQLHILDMPHLPFNLFSGKEIQAVDVKAVPRANLRSLDLANSL